MKLLRTLLLLSLCAVMVLLSACPAPIPPAPGSSTTSGSGSGSGSGSQPGSGSGSQPGSGSGNTGGDPTIPTGAVYRPTDTGERADYWQKLAAPTGSFAASAYTNAADGLFSQQQVIPTVGTDAAFAFIAPYDGLYEIGADLLAVAVSNAVGTLAVYKGTAKIWPVTEDSYTFTAENGADRFTATTAAKKGDLIYIRASGDAPLFLTPRVTLLSDAYEESRDLEKNFPTVGLLSDVGASIPAGDFVMQPIAIPAGASSGTYTAQQVGNAITRNNATAGTVYYVQNDADVTLDFTGRNADYSCDGKGAYVVTAGKITIKGLNVPLSNLTLIADGGVYLESADGGKLTKVAIRGGLVIGEKAEYVDLASCRIEANGTALENKGFATGALNSYFEGGFAALVDTSKGGEGFYLGCIMKASETAIDLSASSTTVRSCTVYGDIRSGEDVENLLVTKCDVRNVGTIVYDKVHNSVILFNEVENITAKNSTNVYVCENAIYGGLLFDNVRYLIAEDNTLATADATLVSVRDHNGDNVTDVTARADYGVNEDLLPHVNLDAHLMMARKKGVRNIERKYALITDYIRENIADNTDLIIPPGAYDSENGSIRFSNIENANIYAYGVLFERASVAECSLELSGCKNVGFFGLTMGLSRQSSGQIQVLEKLGNGKLLCVVGAGVVPEWSFDTLNRHEIGYRENSLSSYGDIGSSFDASNPPKFDEDGYITFTYPQTAYETIEVGDVITCRKGGSLTRLQSSSGIVLEDITVLGGAIRCFWDDYNEEGTTINRAVDTRMPAKIIDKATYDRYKQIESVYGINTGVYIDELGNYRGTESRSATADFAHANSNRSGFQVSNSIVDGLTDDGTNNQGLKARVYGYDIETGKVLYKNDSTWGYGESISGGLFKAKAGDTIKIYTIAGQVVANEEILQYSSAKPQSDGLSYGYFYIAPGNEALAAAIEKINPDSINSGDFKILCECPETNSPNATFDNVLFKNIRSRACLIKGDGVRIENCSFYNIGMAAVALNYEPKYGEAGLPSDGIIRNNYFEGTGNYEDKKYYSPISVDAPAVQGGEDYMTSHNLLVEGNVIRDRYTAHALYISGSMNVTIKDNDFGDRYDGEPSYAVYMDFVRDVEISGNTYSLYYENTAAAGVACTNYVNVHGDDIDGVWDDRLITDATYTTTWVEHIPYVENGTVKYKGNWDAGFLPAASMNLSKFQRFNTVQGGGPMFFSYNNGAWSTSGAVSSIARDYRFITAKGSNPAIRYTMDRDATVALAIAEFFPPYPPTDGLGSGDALFAIYVNDEMVWPTEGGSYTRDGDWYYIDRNSNVADLNKSLANVTLSLSEGDQILFLAKWPSWGVEESLFAATPNVYYLG